MTVFGNCLSVYLNSFVLHVPVSHFIQVFIYCVCANECVFVCANECVHKLNTMLEITGGNFTFTFPIFLVGLVCVCMCVLKFAANLQDRKLKTC